MTETNGKTNVPARVPLTSGGKIAAIAPQSIEEVFRLASAIAAAGFAPKAYGTDANKITVGIIHGMEVGLTPMAALQSIAVINGTPTIWGDGALALVRASGHLENMEEKLEGSGDTFAAICTMQRKGQATPIVGRFSVADAKKAGLWGKQGPWSQYPQRMLQMRARSWAMRDGFADALKGMGIREDMHDMGTLTADADGTFRPEPPSRAQFDHAAQGYGDLDQQFKETVQEPDEQPTEPPTPDADTAEVTQELAVHPMIKHAEEIAVKQGTAALSAWYNKQTKPVKKILTADAGMWQAIKDAAAATDKLPALSGAA